MSFSLKKEVSIDGKNLEKAISELENISVKVGWFERNKYLDNKSTPVSFVAAQNEFGNPAKNIPARPFMRPAAIKNKILWDKVAEKGIKEAIKGVNSFNNGMKLLGDKVAGDIRKEIKLVFEPPLKQSTISARLAKKKNKKKIGLLTKPLIDSGIMLDTVTSEVEKG